MAVRDVRPLLELWEDVRAVDHHCHPLRRWPLQLTELELRSAFTEAVDPAIIDQHVIHTAAYQGALHRIAAELHCDPSEGAILAHRNAADAANYARQLLGRTATEVMLFDQGFASVDAFTVGEQQQATGIPQLEIIRLETLAENLVKTASDPREWFANIRAALRADVARGAIGVKTICAYRASLKLEPVDTDALGVAFSSLRSRTERDEPLRMTGNAICHALVFEAAKECQELDVPLQVHCGFGAPDEDLADASPLGLRPLLIDPSYRGLRIALLHCYPYHREAAYLCSVFPAVYMALWLMTPFAALDGVRAMHEALGLCPTSKLLYASDATRYPEVYLVAATLHREALAETLGELVERRVMSRSAAVEAGRQVLAGTARRLYPLPNGPRQ